MGMQAGIPLFYLQGMGGGAVLKFRDLFNDSSQFWGWRLFLGEISTVGKSGVEANGRYTLAVLDTKNGRWDTDDNEAPRLFTSILTYPCEIKTRLDLFTNVDDGCAGLFISKGPISFGADNHFAIVRKKTATTNGIAVVKDAQTLASYINTTLPVWFRIRLGSGGYHALNAYFDYSYDGLNWTNLWVHNTGWTIFGGWGLSTGLFVNNFTSANEVVGAFDYFEMKPKSIN